MSMHGVRQEGVPQGKTTIRVFYPNPLPGTYNGDKENGISRLFNVTYLWKNDPIYHELMFTDDKGIRHQIIGLAYHIQEEMPASGGVDAVL